MGRTGRVLVVDDEVSARATLADLLRDDGYQVEMAADAFKALGKYEAFAPHVVVTDLHMPGMDGVELVQRLRAGDTPPAVIVMTAFGAVESAVEAMRAGAADYLTKPLDFEQLLRVLDRVLEHHRRRAELRAPALDRLLWVFLRLLLSEQALERFLRAADGEQLKKNLTDLQARQQAAQTRNDDRILRSLTDSIATAELRVDNYEKAKSNAEFIAVELDRIENKIQALTEMAISHQDPDAISAQVDAVAEGMSQTEDTIRQLQSITGMTEADSTPDILSLDVSDTVTAK